MSNGNVTVAFHYSHYYCCCWCCYYCCCCSSLGPCCCCFVFCLLFGRQRGCHLWWRWWVLYSFLAVVVCLLCSLDLPLMTCIILWKFCVCLTSLASLSSPLFPIGFFGRLRKLFYAVVMPPSTAPAPCQLYFCCVIILLLLSTPLLHQFPPFPFPFRFKLVKDSRELGSKLRVGPKNFRRLTTLAIDSTWEASHLLPPPSPPLLLAVMSRRFALTVKLDGLSELSMN